MKAEYEAAELPLIEVLLVVVHDSEFFCYLEALTPEQLVVFAIASEVPNTKVTRDPVDLHFFEAEAVVSQLLKVLIHGLFDYRFSLVTLEVLNLNDKHQVGVASCMADSYIRLHSLPKLLDRFFSVNAEVTRIESETGFLPQLRCVKLLDECIVEHLHRKKSYFPLHVKRVFHAAEHCDQVVNFLHQRVHI